MHKKNVLSMVFMLSVACSSPSPSEPTTDAPPAPVAEKINEPKSQPMPIARSTAPIPDWAKSIILPVQGMTCAGCEQAINEALENADGIFRSEANHYNGNVKVHYDPAKTKPALMVNAINELGYQADLFGKKDKDLKKVERKPANEIKGHEKVGKDYLEKAKKTFKKPTPTP